MLEPLGYKMEFYIKADMEKLHFTYFLHSEIKFTLSEATDQLVFESLASYVYMAQVVYNKTWKILVDDYQMGEVFYLQTMDKTLVPAGRYTLTSDVIGLITEDTRGIKYVLHRDRKTKNW